MDEYIKLRQTLQEVTNEEMIRVILSNPKLKDGIIKIKLRPVKIEEKLQFQATEYVGTQVFHKNLTETEAVSYLEQMIRNSFKQCEIITAQLTIHILVSKKGKVTISKKKSNATQIKLKQAGDLSHNRTKQYILKEGIPVPFLIDLGVMNSEGMVLKPKYDKFKQINRFLEYVRDVADELPKDREVKIIDFGCGKSYLTFAIYYYLHELRGLDVQITGLDLKKNVIQTCNSLSESYGYEKLIFQMGDIKEYNDDARVDMVVTLHACDTATDYALIKAVTWNAKVILSVPCCQHELNKQIRNDIMSPVLQYGILKDRMSALMTDAIRAEVLKIKGYETDILEFIDMEHTPKNLLIRAVKKNEKGNRKALEELLKEFHITPTITTLL